MGYKDHQPIRDPKIEQYKAYMKQANGRDAKRMAKTIAMIQAEDPSIQVSAISFSDRVKASLPKPEPKKSKVMRYEEPDALGNIHRVDFEVKTKQRIEGVRQGASGLVAAAKEKGVMAKLKRAVAAVSQVKIVKEDQIVIKREETFGTHYGAELLRRGVDLEQIPMNLRPVKTEDLDPSSPYFLANERYLNGK